MGPFFGIAYQENTSINLKCADFFGPPNFLAQLRRCNYTLPLPIFNISFLTLAFITRFLPNFYIHERA